MMRIDSISVFWVELVRVFPNIEVKANEPTADQGCHGCVVFLATLKVSPISPKHIKWKISEIFPYWEDLRKANL